MRAELVFLIIYTCVLYVKAADNNFIAEPVPRGIDSTPKTSICNNFKDLFDDGVYLKTACFVHQSLSYDAAKYKCAENNMNLFVINTNIVASHLQDAAQEKYPSGNFWVNAKRQSLSKRWQVYNIDGTVRGSLNSNIQFYSNHASGNCLKISTDYSGIFSPLPRNCADKSYFVCEHFQRTQDPPTLDTSKCLYRRDLYNYNSYLKSLCTISQSLDYDQARRTCARYGMNLFMFDSAEVDESFFEVTEDIMKNNPGGYWWINGLRNPKTNEWSLYHANRVLKGPLYDGFEFVTLSGTNGVTSGDCLRLSGQKGPYQGLGYDCEAKSHIICEYK